jgi:hypothetical protein
MSVFKRVGDLFRGRTARLRRLKQGALYLMKHVQMTGYCECLGTRDADDQAGYLLVVNTHQIIPVAERELIQSYFRRKLAEFGETGSLPLMVVVRDGDDLSRAAQPAALASSARIASIIVASNQSAPEGPSSQLLRQRREDLAAERKHRFGEGEAEADEAQAQAQAEAQAEADAYVPAREMPLTDLMGPEHLFAAEPANAQPPSHGAEAEAVAKVESAEEEDAPGPVTPVVASGLA